MVAGYGPKQIGLALIGVTQEAAIHVKFRMKGLFVKNEMRQDVDNFETESERNLAKFLGAMFPDAVALESCIVHADVVVQVEANIEGTRKDQHPFRNENIL